MTSSVSVDKIIEKKNIEKVLLSKKYRTEKYGWKRNYSKN